MGNGEPRQPLGDVRGGIKEIPIEGSALLGLLIALHIEIVTDAGVYPKHYTRDVDRVLIPYGLIRDRVEKLAHMIARDCRPGTPVVACCVLKGAYTFFAHLTEVLKKLATPDGGSIPLSFEFIKVKSYVDTHSSGQVQISLSEEDLKSFEGKQLLIVEDIVDTGRTMIRLTDLLKQYRPASIKVASLLLKKTHAVKRDGKFPYVPDYVGFAIPDIFVVGYALDYNEIFRDLDHICVISETGKEKYSITHPASSPT